MDEHYTIKPLTWERAEHREYWYAETPFGAYTVQKRLVFEEDSDHWLKGESCCSWSFCFDEYHDEGWFPCSTIEEGKEAAVKHWRERITEALEPVTKGRE